MDGVIDRFLPVFKLLLVVLHIMKQNLSGKDEPWNMTGKKYVILWKITLLAKKSIRMKFIDEDLN